MKSDRRLPLAIVGVGLALALWLLWLAPGNAWAQVAVPPLVGHVTDLTETLNPDQQASLEQEFRTMLLRTYTGALSQVRDQTVQIKPSRAVQDGDEVIVRTEVRGKGDPIQLDYRLEKSPTTGWKIYDVNVLGVWLVENYRNSFAQEITASGIDGLINKLAQRNKTAAART